MHLILHTLWVLVGLLACLGSIVNADSTLEIVVVFPRSNETYAPKDKFPIIFAIQNAELAKYFKPSISLLIRNGSNLESAFGHSIHDLRNTEFSTEPYFVYLYANIDNEGPHKLFATATWQSCDESGDQVSIRGNTTNLSVDFTIKKGGQEADLTTATTNDDTCSANDGVAINVTGKTYEVPPSGERGQTRAMQYHALSYLSTMLTSPWITAALGSFSLVPGVVAFIPPVATAPRVIDFCPERCAVSGPRTGNWSVYPNFKRIKRCEQTMFYDFSVYDPVDDPETNHRIWACSSFGSDFDNMPSEAVAPNLVESASPIDVEFELGWWQEGFGLAKPAIRSLVRQLREYIDHGHGASHRPFILYGRSGQATVGIYIGQGLVNQGISASALRNFQDSFDTLDVTTPSLAMQLCGPSYDSARTFGIAVTSNGTFAPIQNAILSWANATCLSFLGSTTFSSLATFTTPLLSGGTLANSTLTTNSTVRARHRTHARSLETHAKVLGTSGKFLQARADCRTVQVDSGEGCAELAVKCGISGADFTKYNPDICGTLKPKQHVCCSSGSLPDVRPKPNADGSCFSYSVQDDDNCANLGAEYGLTNDDIEGFNKDTWGWSGCDPLFAKAVICLSTGKPPFPAAIANAECGPQKPGSEAPTDGSSIADLNPCPLNACCNIWGHCGVTTDFCVDTSTGPPGTAEPGTYGCISNCGIDVIKGTGTGAIKLAYFQGYGMNRPCLYQDALQIDTSKYTHLHFGFGTLTPSYEVQVGDALSSYQFGEFKRIQGAKRILSFGGWAFSTEPNTYLIFRHGVRAENRLTMATNIADFIKKHDLDGVDIDWEYPGAPDLPENDPGTAEDGPNYLAFLAVLKNLLPGKTVAIAAPASYWYLKQFPIKDIARIVDYIVYMTYDLHGQWDAHSEYTQEGCETGNCLRSQVNLTETRLALAMITKAGVPGHKIVVGVTSYGRSFAMEQAGCWGPTCKFTGSRLDSHATPGRCTGTGGYLADAEINEIISGGSGAKRQSNRVVTHFLDTSSNSDILVYDDNQWVGYMSEKTKQIRSTLYASLGMGGTTDWASDLQEFHSPPKPAKDWASFISLAASGSNPKEDTTSIGTWKTFDCTHEVIDTPHYFTPSARWKAVDTDSAWQEVIDKWLNTDSTNNMNFIESVQQTLKMGAEMGCETMDPRTDHCHGPTECEKAADGEKSGPAAQFIWSSLINIHTMHHGYWDALQGMTGSFALSADDMEDTFAPIPEPDTNQWLNIMIDLLTIGTLTTAAPFFNGFLKQLPAFSNPKTYDTTESISMNLISQTTTLAKDMLKSPKPDNWTPQEQNKFSNYVGQAIFGWMNSTELGLKKLFDGTPESIRVLEDAIANGNLIEGQREEPERKDTSATELQANVLKSFFGFSIPALWRRSKTYAFVIDSGANCDGRPLGKYLADSTADDTGVCYQGRRYYLVHPDGEARLCRCDRITDGGPCERVCQENKFSVPVGLGELSRFGGITKEDLVIGSVRTWLKNGKKNGGGVTDPINDAGARTDLIDMDVTTPGFVRLPVCSPERAFQSWETGTKGGSDNYPCDIPPGKDRCGDSTFEDQTSDASPLVSDCEKIIQNIEADGSTEFTHRITGHREILSYGSCAFGIERTGGTGGAVEFKVGGQDVIDVIHDAVKRFGGGGKVGAKGVMSCDGTTAGTHVNVLWGIY
ncbi:related to RF2 protein [Cephalotrichum gorgonifer]|uniref:chitinase n=1 Tax=Cephalotrichum gorgonifer TaxID=2041049 RepID=A0AAE8MVT2_9PEZI|nr:related to RF2 protein [Cephalotrichum gorgonifer]